QKGNYTVFETQGMCTAKSAAITAKSNPVPPAYVAVYGQLDICNTGYVMARANGANSPYTYQWLKSGLVMQGGTSRNITLTTSGVYSVMVSNSQNCSKTSIPFTVYSS